VVAVLVLVVYRHAAQKHKATSKPVSHPATAPVKHAPPATPTPTPVSHAVGDALTEQAMKTDPNIVFFGGFEASPWTNTMHPVLSTGNENFSLQRGAGYGNSLALRTFYKKGSYASHDSPVGTSATIFKIPFGANGINIGTATDLYFRFLVKFQPGFAFGKSGKLPGLAGGADNAGGRPPNGYDGWSSRLDWVEGGGLISYLYVPGIEKYGMELDWEVEGEGQLLTPGSWDCLEMHTHLNTPGKNDGLAQGWINDKLALDAKDINYRATDKLTINNILFDTFFGGATVDYASPQDQYADFDNFALSTSYIACPK